jgi:O-antigen/teichoic acid export membrane protein
MALLTAPLALMLIVAAHPILGIWIGTEFAEQAAAPLQILALGIVPSAIAQVSFASIQARGRSDLTAALHLLELPVYMVIIWVSASSFGAAGAAAAWLIRVVLDAAILQVLVRQLR